MRLAAALAALALIVAACGNGEDQAQPITDDDVAATEEAATDDTALDDEDEEAVEADTQEENGQIVYPHVLGVENLDPDQNSQGFPLPMIMPVYDRLIHMSPDTGELIPGLAEAWELTDDGDVIELQLRQGVAFHDGAEFNAEAVQLNIERSRTLPEAHADVQSVSAAIGEVEVVDDYTVRLHRSEGEDLAWSLLIPRLTENIGMMISPDALDNADLDRAPVGAGPFRFVSFGADRVEYERFEEYWDPDDIGVAGLTMLQPMDPEPRLNALVAGEINIAQIEPEQIDAAEDAGLEVVVQDSLVVWHLYLNHSREPLDSLEVRQAIVHAIDREAIVDVLTRGTGTATAQTFPPDYAAYNPDHGIDRYPHDPDRARELLESAGYGDGISLNFELLNRPDIVQLGEVLQAQLGEVGIDLELDVTELAARGGWLAGDYDLILGPRSRLDPLQILAEVVAQDGNFNPGGFTTDEIQGIVDDAEGLLADSDERLELVRELSGVVTEEGYLITIYAEATVWAHDSCLEGFLYPIQTYVEFRHATLSTDC